MEPLIESIELTVITADISGAGTDGDIYLGFGGREFYADSSADDFERGSSRTYVFGNGGNTSNPPHNDPRDSQLRLENAELLPVYIRFQPTGRGDNWKLLRASVAINGGSFGLWDTAGTIPFDEKGGIWLGTRAGLVVFVARHSDKPTGAK